MSLPMSWVDEIFKNLALVYGQQFLNRWRDLDMGAVKKDWAEKLASLERAPKAITYALDNLDPVKPPTVLEFRALAYRAPAPDVPRLEAPLASPDRVAAELARLANLRRPGAAADPKAWAVKLIDRHNAGQRVSPAALKDAQRALMTAGQRAGLVGSDHV